MASYHILMQFYLGHAHGGECFHGNGKTGHFDRKYPRK